MKGFSDIGSIQFNQNQININNNNNIYQKSINPVPNQKHRQLPSAPATKHQQPTQPHYSPPHSPDLIPELPVLHKPIVQHKQLPQPIVNLSKPAESAIKQPQQQSQPVFKHLPNPLAQKPLLPTIPAELTPESPKFVLQTTPTSTTKPDSPNFR